MRSAQYICAREMSSKDPSEGLQGSHNSDNTTMPEFICVAVSLAMPANLIRRDYWISLYGTMTILPDDVIVMTRYSGIGKIDGDT